MSLVQSNLLKFAQIVCPTTKGTSTTAAVEFTAANIGTLTGANMTAQEMLDKYNYARYAMLLSLRNRPDFTHCVYGSALTAAITFAAGTGECTATRPNGAIRIPFIVTYSGVVAPVLDLMAYNEFIAGNPDYAISATSIWCYERGQSLVIPSQSIGVGAGKISYYGISDWALSDVTGGTAYEVFRNDFEPALIQLAVAIHQDQGEEAVMALANKLVGA
jgi:hypothetical protein